MNKESLQNSATKIRISCARGGILELDQNAAHDFIASSLEDTIDLLNSVINIDGNDTPHPRTGLASIALSRVQEALDTLQAIPKIPE